MKHTFIKAQFLLLGMIACTGGALAQTMGNVTPASVTMTITSLSLIPVSTTGQNVSLYNGSKAITWNAADADFSGTSVADLTVPEGRFVGAVVGYTTDRTVLLSGYRYQGARNTGASVLNGYFPYSTGATTWAFSATSTASTTPLKFTQAGGATSTYFGGITCIATASTKAAVCQTGDTYVDASVKSNLSFNLLLDLYNLGQIDSDRTSFDGSGNGFALNLYPYVVFGGLGAAVHLTLQTGAGATMTQGDITLLLDPNKNFVFAYSNTWVNSGTGPAGWCNTPGSTRGATAAPSGKVLNPWGTDLIGQYDAANGFLAFQASDGGGTSGKGGIVVLGDIRKATGNTVPMNCFGDGSAAITTWDSNFLPFLGWTYPARNPTSYGPTGTALTPTIVKVADPGGILGIPTCGPTVKTGCGTYPQ